MPNYSEGKIYKLTCETGKVYVGSTIRSLKRRYGNHITEKNNCTTKDFINPKIELIETYPCETKEQLLWKEREYIENTECINKVMPIASTEEKRNQRNKSTKKHRYNNLEKYREKTTCKCGGIYISSNKARHLNSKKHLNYVEALNINL